MKMTKETFPGTYKYFPLFTLRMTLIFHIPAFITQPTVIIIIIIILLITLQ